MGSSRSAIPDHYSFFSQHDDTPFCRANSLVGRTSWFDGQAGIQRRRLPTGLFHYHTSSLAAIHKTRLAPLHILVLATFGRHRYAWQQVAWPHLLAGIPFTSSVCISGLPLPMGTRDLDLAWARLPCAVPPALSSAHALVLSALFSGMTAPGYRERSTAVRGA